MTRCSTSRWPPRRAGLPGGPHHVRARLPGFAGRAGAACAVRSRRGSRRSGANSSWPTDSTNSADADEQARRFESDRAERARRGQPDRAPGPALPRRTRRRPAVIRGRCARIRSRRHGRVAAPRRSTTSLPFPSSAPDEQSTDMHTLESLPAATSPPPTRNWLGRCAHCSKASPTWSPAPRTWPPCSTGACRELNWAGFYLVEPRTGDLLLGPFQGKPACVRIPIGKGVCGTAAERRETVVVADVHAFPGHIACDSASNSEIVVPIIDGERLIGVLDLDSPVPGALRRGRCAGARGAGSGFR